ncbi:MAG: hypothetical protein WCJ35_23465 [Planctomycetota bacterium]
MSEDIDMEDDFEPDSDERVDKSRSRRTEMSFDRVTGRYCAKLGRKKTKSNKIDGHKFRFTPDSRESERRKIPVEQHQGHPRHINQIAVLRGRDCGDEGHQARGAALGLLPP